MPALPVQLTAIFDDFDAFIRGLEVVRSRRLSPCAVYSPMPLEGYDELLPRRSIIATCLALGALMSGCALAFWLCVDAGRMLVMARSPRVVEPHVPGSIVSFEYFALVAALLAIAVVVWVISTPPRVLPTERYPGLTQDEYAFSVACAEEQEGPLREALTAAGAAAIQVG